MPLDPGGASYFYMKTMLKVLIVYILRSEFFEKWSLRQSRHHLECTTQTAHIFITRRTHVKCARQDRNYKETKYYTIMMIDFKIFFENFSSRARIIVIAKYRQSMNAREDQKKIRLLVVATSSKSDDKAKNFCSLRHRIHHPSS